MKKDHDLRVYDDIESLIASPENPTPLVKVGKSINPNPEFPIYLKLEGYNPYGSIKDRVASMMLENADIGEGQSLVESSPGNLGIALAALANARGIPVEVAVSERIPQSKKDLLKLLGVELLEAPDDLCPDFPNEGERGLARSMAVSPRHEGKYVHLNQYENEYNVRAHYENTGPEIWKQTGGDIDYFFASFLTCGTIAGVGRYLKEQKPSIRIIGVEPEKEVHGLPGMKRITGLRDDLIPIIHDESIVDDIVAVSDEDAYKMGIRLVKEAGVFVGPTTGAILHAALGYAKEGKGLAVVISPDDVFKYVENYLKYVE